MRGSGKKIKEKKKVRNRCKRKCIKESALKKRAFCLFLWKMLSFFFFFLEAVGGHKVKWVLVIILRCVIDCFVIDWSCSNSWIWEFQLALLSINLLNCSRSFDLSIWTYGRKGKNVFFFLIGTLTWLCELRRPIWRNRPFKMPNDKTEFHIQFSFLKTFDLRNSEIH